VTPFAVITDEKTGIKYPLADYELLPDMAIVDADMMMNAPKGLTAASGIDALTHALEAYVSMLATDYTDSLALRAIKMIFEYLPRAYENGASDPVAREKMANAATIAGMAFANAFWVYAIQWRTNWVLFITCPRCCQCTYDKRSNQIQLIRGSDQDGYFPAV